MNRRLLLSVIILPLIMATPGFATYSIPRSVLANCGGSGISGGYDLAYIAGQSSPAVVAEGEPYDLYGGYLSGNRDYQPPLIGHTPISLVLAHTPLEITAKVIDARSGVDSVILWFREGGRLGFRTKRMQTISDSVFTATIPPSLISERGVAYYLEAYDLLGNVSRMPSQAPSEIIVVRVWFNDLTSVSALPEREYRMISLPGSTNGSPDSVLVDDFGFYDRTIWRLGRWNSDATGCSAGCYEEYPDIEDFAPGRAFWLISNQAKTFDFSGTNVDISKPYRIHLSRGWNQIATPFAFPTDWPSAEVLYNGQHFPVGELYTSGADTIYVEDNLTSYDGTYHGFQSELKPWEGYWIYNASSSDVDLLLYPTITTPELQAECVSIQLGPLVAICLRRDGTELSRAIAGVSPDAKDGFDELDLHAPPPIGEYARVVFYETPTPNQGGAYSRSIKQGSSQGAQWQITVETSEATTATLDIEIVRELPSGWQIVVYDLDAGLRLTASDLPYMFRASARQQFWLVMGSSSYVEAYEDNSAIDLEPKLIAINPNPFVDQTTIRFFVAGQSRVKMSLYDARGRLIYRLADTDSEPGVHSVRWDGSTLRGQRVSAGIYFLTFECDKIHQTHKVIRLE